MFVLNVIASLGSKNGGTTESCLRLSDALVARGHEVDYAVLDSDLDGITDQVAARTTVFPSRGGVYSWSARLVQWLKANARKYDIVVVHGIWQYQSIGVFVALRESTVPYVVFPHGGLGTWFKRTYPLKHLKKWLYWPWADYRVLRSAGGVFFACEGEMLDARKSFWLYSAREKIVEFGTDIPAIDREDARGYLYARFPRCSGKRIVTFMGRLHPVKGCDLLIRAFARLKDKLTDVHLLIVGSDPVNWRSDLKTLAAKNGIEDSIEWVDFVSGMEKWNVIFGSSVVCLPSHYENYSMVAIETIGASVPLIVTNKFMLAPRLQREGVALVEDDTEDGIYRALSLWSGMDLEGVLSMSTQQRKFYDSYLTVDSMGRIYEEGLLSVIKDKRTAGII